MKRLKVSSVVVAAMMLMVFASCKDRVEKGIGFGVAEVTSGKTALKTVSFSFGNFLGLLYSPAQEDLLVDGNCYMYGYEINYDNKNTVQSKYTVATITDLKKIPLSSIEETYQNPGYDKPQSNSLAINQASMVTYINSRLFVATEVDQYEKQEVGFKLYYNLEDTELKKDQYNIYNLYIVSEKLNDVPSSLITRKTDYAAFNIETFMKRAIEREEARDYLYLAIRLCYIDSINKDGTFTSKKSDQIIPIYIGK